jgi:hypothetical protein
LDAISARLLSKGVPVNIVRGLHYLNLSSFVLKPPYLLNEFENTLKALITKGRNPDEVINSPRPISYSYRARGVPQGAPTSPLLASITLEGSIFDRGIPCVMYADDGLYYGKIENEPITPNSGMVTHNVHFNLNKSG